MHWWFISPTFSILGFVFPLMMFFLIFRIVRGIFRSSHRNIESRMRGLSFPESDPEFSTITRYPPIRPPTTEGEIFRLADEMKGRLTLSDIVIATNLSLKEAEGVINSMVDGTHVTMEVRDNGRIVYEFPEIIARHEDSGADA